jgi:Co/Zn/Cd efflux system component
MSASCNDHCQTAETQTSARYRRVLWIGLLVNLAMFMIEIVAGWKGGSVSLLADAVDFFGDGVNFAASIFALTLAAVWRSRVALYKGYVMFAYGVFIVGRAVWAGFYGATPEHELMGYIGVLALMANVSVAILLYAYREGDANMRSVWICTRNDAIGNVLILVFGTGTRWPDLVVAAMMGALAVVSGINVIRRATLELEQGMPVTIGHAHNKDDGHGH